MPAMATERLERGGRFAVRHVDLAVARTATDQQAGLVRAVLEEAQVAHRTVVHGQLHLLALELLLGLVEAHQLDGFVVRAGRNEIAGRRPRHTVDRAFVVLGALEQHRRLVRAVVFPEVETRCKTGVCIRSMFQ